MKTMRFCFLRSQLVIKNLLVGIYFAYRYGSLFSCRNLHKSAVRLNAPGSDWKGHFAPEIGQSVNVIQLVAVITNMQDL